MWFDSIFCIHFLVFYDSQTCVQLHLRIQVVLPLQHGIERGGPGHVEHHQGSDSLPVVHTSHVPIPLLSWDTATAVRHTHTQRYYSSPLDRNVPCHCAKVTNVCEGEFKCYSGYNHVTKTFEHGISAVTSTRSKFHVQAAKMQEIIAYFLIQLRKDIRLIKLFYIV